MNKLLNFGGDPNHRSVSGLRITDPYPDRDTSKTCLGIGMHCPSASS